MLRKVIILSLLLSGLLLPVCAQISHGGKPLPLALVKSGGDSFFEEMPAFDVAEELRLDSLNESDMRSGYKFAYKFMTNFNRANSGISFILPDGTRVWRMGIRSKGALSINVLFTEYELPEGAKLFLYNSDQSHILGAFNHLNNSTLGILPVAPVYGDELIVEYQEPANVSFAGRLTIGEVNHAYRDLKAAEPSDTKTAYNCMPPAFCYADPADGSEQAARSVVLLIIDGTVGCSGVLVNNTANDSKPYLLTASHCLNLQFRVVNPDYEHVAGTIVSFFNYDSPLCDTTLRGAEEMSMASTYFHAVNEEHDMALLELLQVPPVYYRPYFSGWNAKDAGVAPYYNMHHPGSSIKRFNFFNGDVTLATYETSAYPFATDAHWFVERWTMGSTSGGSSGSPLFDNEGHVIGCLSGGQSSCANPVEDYFFALSQAWDADPASGRQLKHWLNPGNKAQLICEGLDPYAGVEAARLSNVRTSGYTERAQVATVSGSNVVPLFGNNDSGVTEYAEAYTVSQKTRLHGAYFVTSGSGNTANTTIEVVVYSGKNKPETVLHTDTLRPAYKSYLASESTASELQFIESNKSLSRKEESYLRFSKPVYVDGAFFISYRIINPPDLTYFSAYSLPFATTSRNTAWVKSNVGWQQASVYSGVGYNTSLYIDPVVQYNGDVGTANAERVSPVYIQSDREQQMLHIVLPDGMTEGACYLYTIDGKLIQYANLNTAYTSLNVSVHTPGIYVVNVFCNGVIYTQKVLF